MKASEDLYSLGKQYKVMYISSGPRKLCDSDVTGYNMEQWHSPVDPAFSAMMPEGQLAQFKDALRKLKPTINLPECSQEQLKSDWPSIEIQKS